MKFNPSDEGAIWNLGIAATVLNYWRTARKCWNYFGLNLEITDEEPKLNLSITPVRLNPDNGGEVVWCKRTDPARAVIDSIPLPPCQRRYGDMVLNDGTATGFRVIEVVGYPVFNELQLLKRSRYSTYSVTAYTNDQKYIDKLIALCRNENVEVEEPSGLPLYRLRLIKQPGSQMV